MKAVGIIVCIAGLYVVNAPEKKAVEAVAEGAAEPKKKFSFAKWIPVILMIVANTLYSVTAKVTPTDVDTFASVSLTYLVCIVYALIMFFITSSNKNYFKEIKKANWTAPVLGACLVCLEVSTILLFRVGWELSVGLAARIRPSRSRPRHSGPRCIQGKADHKAHNRHCDLSRRRCARRSRVINSV